MSYFESWATHPAQRLTVHQEQKLDEAEAIVCRTQSLCCNVWLQCHCCTMELPYVYMSHAIAMKG